MNVAQFNGGTQSQTLGGNEAGAGSVQSARENSHPAGTPTTRPFLLGQQPYSVLYLVALAVSVGLWFVAIRAPLWLDETISFWQINGGISSIWLRRGLSSPEYAYILWFFTKLIGTSEIALRVPSMLAMLGAVYLLYRAASELFERDIAFIVCTIFSLHAVIVFAAIDARPYAFAALAINAAIFTLVRMRRSDSNWLAALLGVSAAFIVNFQPLFAGILPALVICFFAVARVNRKLLGRPLVIALSAFTVAFLPSVPTLLYMFRTSGSHVSDRAPNIADLLWTVAPVWVAICCGIVAFLASASRKLDLESRVEAWRVVFCAALGLIPIVILFGVSVVTPIHIFAYRYRLVAIPGIALCWGWILSRVESRVLRLFFCAGLVAITSYRYVSNPESVKHGYTWKYALEVLEKHAAPENAPVLMCSGVIEADYEPMPSGPAKDSELFAPLTYYKLTVPVVSLPRGLNEEAVRVAAAFLQNPATRHQHFFAVGWAPSYPTLDWIANRASQTHQMRVLGTFDGVAVVEFLPIGRD